MLMFITLGTTAQKDSIYIAEQKDEMTDKSYYFPSRQLICQNPDNKGVGFAASFFIGKANNGDLEVRELKMKIIGVGSCHEKDEVILLLDDGTKVKAVMWNDFNCDGKVWCKVDKSDMRDLAIKKVIKIRVQNGRTFESYTHVVSVSEQDYFNQLFYAVQYNIIKPFK